MENNNDIQDSLYEACSRWLELYANGASREEKRRAAKPIWGLWKSRYRVEMEKGNKNFPSPKDFIPPKQWQSGNITYDCYFLEFVGAIGDFIEKRHMRRGR